MRRVLLLGLILLPIANANDPGPIPPKDAPKAMKVPDGFKVTLFAGEPDVVQPIAFAFDDRGRLWVVECLSYPKWTKDGKGKDRVVIFEDTDGDGVHDKRTVFWDQGSNLSGIEVGHGGVWLCSTPNLIFISFKEGEDKPAGEPKIVLDGWSLEAKHNVFNSLTWGPDGWLYGCNGILSNSLVAAPGTPKEQRSALNCGVWRYHPATRQFEPVASGTTNPWGLDFDSRGEMFITNCVIKHLFHVVPGAHFVRMFGEDINPHAYGLIDSVADHIHWGGGDWTSSRGGKGVHSDAGGGHAHSGCMVYLGDNWPESYRDHVFTCNIHGNRVNDDRLVRDGSSYIAKHSDDFLFANDPWFRGLTIKYGPDGGVFICDWTDTGECHNYEVADVSNGRIYKVVYNKATPYKTDLKTLSDRELIKLQGNLNEWIVNHARRILQERKIASRFDANASVELVNVLNDKNAIPHDQLRALWCLNAVDALGEGSVNLVKAHEDVRAWFIRLMLDKRNASPTFLKSLAALARREKSPTVRLALACGLQRIPTPMRWEVAESLVLEIEDDKDAYLPSMVWYGVEPLVPLDRDRALKLLAESKISLVRQNISRRVASLPGNQLDHLNALVDLLAQLPRRPARDLLVGMREALKGQRKVPLPERWLVTYPSLTGGGNNPGAEAAMQLTAQFGDPQALEALRRTALAERADRHLRGQAVSALANVGYAELGKLLKELYAAEGFRGVAIRHFAAVNDPDVPKLLLGEYTAFTPEEKADAVSTLASRKEYASALLDAMEKGTIPRTDVSVFVARQMLSLQDKAVAEKLTKVWGQIRSTSKDRVALTLKYKELLTDQYLSRADTSRGRNVFASNCAACHKLFDDGGEVGPTLTGSQRGNLDYILENVLDPSAVVAKEYQLQEFHLFSGRLVSGIVKQELDKVVVVQTQNEILNIAKEDIETRKLSKVSMMPEGLFDKLKDDEVRDLIAYLRSSSQVPKK